MMKYAISLLLLSFSLYGHSDNDFTMLYHISHKGAPDLTEYGFQESRIVYEQEFYPNNRNEEPITEPNFQRVVSNIRETVPKGSFVQIDIESWGGKGRFRRQRAREMYLSTAIRLESALPDYKVGYYRIVPAWAHWDLLKNPREYDQWLYENKQRQTIANHVDVLYPALYTYHKDPSEWKAIAVEALKKAREMSNGKPVIPFLWPRFHPSSDVGGGGRVYLPPEYWRIQLDVVLKHADGFVIWNDGKTAPWSDTMPWWQQTVDFVNDNFPERLVN